MLNESAISEKKDRNLLEEELKLCGAKFFGNMILCFGHEDKNPSSHIVEDDNGFLYFKCFSPGCRFHVPADIYDLRAYRTNLPKKEILQGCFEKKEIGKNGTKLEPKELNELIESHCRYMGFKELEATYPYTNPRTKIPDIVIVRYSLEDGGKAFVQLRPHGNGYVLGGLEKNPIYNRSRIAIADTVLVCEGEKCVHAAHDIGIIATTSPGGSNSANKADWSPLAGKDVVIWPDNDAPNPKTGIRSGLVYAKNVSEILLKLNPPARVRMINQDNLGLPDKGDIVDFLERVGGDTENKKKSVLEVMSRSNVVSVSSCLFERLDNIHNGKYSNIDMPWKLLSTMTRALLPGSVTVLCGDPGATKSFFLDSLLISLIDSGINSCCYKLEDDLTFHMNRLFAMKQGYSQYLDPVWVKDNYEEVLRNANKLRYFLDSVGSKIICSNDEVIDILKLPEWVEERAKEGYRVITIDPITAAGVSGQQWTDDKKFLDLSKKTCSKYGASLILVTHPKVNKDSSKQTMHDIAGGKSYSRFSHTILMLSSLPGDKRVTVINRNNNDVGEIKVTINRIIKLEKTRNGRGAGMKIGYYFDQDKLSFTEMGIIVPKKSNDEEEAESDDNVPF